MNVIKLMGLHFFNAVKYFCVEMPRSAHLIRSSDLKIMSSLDTVEYIHRTGCSVARFGDGEFALAFNGSIGFQTASRDLQDEIKNVLVAPPPGVLVCLPYCFSRNGMDRLLAKDARGWRRFALEYIPKIRQLIMSWKKCGKCEVFGDSLITRPYMIYRDRENHAATVFKALKKLWADRDVLVVEGEKSRLGVGNDLFACAKQVKRILCPAFNAYDRIDEIESKTLSHVGDALVLIALGPTATVLATRLAKRGLQAIDVGHIDVEYVWFKMGAKQKVPILGKYVHEAQLGAAPIGPCDDVEYIASIVDVVK